MCPLLCEELSLLLVCSSPYCIASPFPLALRSRVLSTFHLIPLSLRCRIHYSTFDPSSDDGAHMLEVIKQRAESEGEGTGFRAKTEGVVNGNKLANNINMLQSCEVEDEDEEDAGDE